MIVPLSPTLSMQTLDLPYPNRWRQHPMWSAQTASPTRPSDVQESQAPRSTTLPTAAPLGLFMPASYHEHAEELETILKEWALGRKPAVRKSVWQRMGHLSNNRIVQTLTAWIVTCILVFFTIDTFATRPLPVPVEDFRKKGMNDAQVLNTAAMYAFDQTLTRWWVGDKRPYLELDPARYYDIPAEVLFSMRIEMRQGGKPFRIDT